MALNNTTFLIIGLILQGIIATPSLSGTLEQANRIYNNLNGHPGSDEELKSIADLLDKGQLTDAALRAIDTEHHSFYHITLRQILNLWANEARSNRFPLTDMQATAIGMVRDGLPFNEFLYADIVYIAENPELPAYSLENNDHYKAIEDQGLELAKVLVRKKQSELTTLVASVSSGALTSRGFSEAYYQGGTNRAALRFTMLNFMCRDMEQLGDTSRPDFSVRRDVSRSPGGDPTIYKTKCVGCHAGMDALAGAFAYFDFDNGSLIYDPISPQAKYSVNSDAFPDGFVSKDNSWKNLWISGPNAILGWRGLDEGQGVKSFGSMVSRSEQFSRCMSQQALSAVCRVQGDASEYATLVNYLATRFERNAYNLKNLFAHAALSCRGD